MASFLGFPYYPARQRSEYAFRLDGSVLLYEDQCCLTGQECLKTLTVELDDPEAKSIAPGYLAFSDILINPEELKRMRVIRIKGKNPFVSPGGYSELPLSLLEGLTFRTLTTVALCNVRLCCVVFAPFLKHTNVACLKLERVDYESYGETAALVSNCKLKKLELHFLPHGMISQLVRGIPNNHKIHLVVSADEKDGRFSQMLWDSICVERQVFNALPPFLPRLNAITFSNGPKFVDHCQIWRNLSMSEVGHVGVQDGKFSDESFDELTAYVGNRETHLRSLCIRYWNTGLDREDGADIHEFLSAIGRGCVEQYVHIGISCSMGHVIASHLPQMGLSAAHFEIVQSDPNQPGSGTLLRQGDQSVVVSPLQRNPGPELIEAARRDKTLGVFAPDRQVGASLRAIKGLSAVGVKQKHYEVTEESDGTSLYWPVFTPTQIDMLRLFERRNIRRAQHRPVRRSYNDEYDYVDQDDDSDQNSNDDDSDQNSNVGSTSEEKGDDDEDNDAGGGRRPPAFAAPIVNNLDDSSISQYTTPNAKARTP